MKKWLSAVSLVLILALLAGLCSCAGTLEEDPAVTETGTAETLPLPESTGEPIDPVPDRSVREKLAALPVANENMTQEELKQLCVDFCVLQGSFQWTPNYDIRYNPGSKDLVFLRGGLYGGLPYTHASSNLYSFLDYYDDATGVFDVSAFKNSVSSYLGNDCADAVFWGWARVCNKIDYILTVYMTPVHGCLKLGNHTYDETADNFRSQPTKEICGRNGAAEMYRSYALMQKADGMVTWNDEGHARMVVENHPVAEGTSFNGDESYAVFVEQWSRITNTDQNGATVMVEGGIYTRYTYRQLFTTGYLPFRLAEFYGTDPVEKAEVHLEPRAEGAEVKDLESLLDCNLISNYRISKVIYTLTDKADGTVAYEGHKYGSESTMYGIPMQTVINKSAIRRAVTSGHTYSLDVRVLVSTGETLDLFSCTITQD